MSIPGQALWEFLSPILEGTGKLPSGVEAFFNEPNQLSVNFGEAVYQQYLGARQAHLFGPDIKLVVDLEDLAVGALAHSFPIGGGIAEVLTGIGGNATFVYGGNRTFVYGGPDVTVKRCQKITVSTDDMSGAGKAVRALSVLLGLATAAIGLTANGLFGNQSGTNDPHNAKKTALQVLGHGIPPRIMVIISMIESAAGLANAAEDKVKAAEGILTQMKNIDAPALKTLAEPLLAAAEERTKAAIAAAAAAAATAAKDAAAAKDLADSETRVFKKTYSVTSDQDISIQAKGANCQVSAANGSLLLDAAKTANINVGPTSLAMQKEGPIGQVHLGAGELGKISLLTGPDIEGPQIFMSPQTIKITVGPPDEGACIELTAETLTLSVGPKGEGSSITMTPESMTLKVAEVTSSFTPEGITEDVAEVTREMTAEGHNLQAAENEWNLGVVGEEKEKLTHAEENEAGKVDSKTLEADLVEGAADAEKSISVQMP